MSRSLLFLNRDAKIVNLIRQGDEQALVMLYHDNRAMVTSYITRNSGSVDDAEEMLQEGIVILWERIRGGSFELHAKLSTFLLGTIKNLWARRLAKGRREISLAEEIDPPSDERSALEVMINAEEQETIRLAMERIGEQCRKLLLMFYWEEKSMEEIAALLGFANADTVKSKKYQCKKSLEQQLKSLRDHE